MSTSNEVKPVEKAKAQDVAKPNSSRDDRRGRGGRQQKQNDENDSGLVERTIFINRVTKVVKGGRRFSFSALVVVGDQCGTIGLGSGKANEVPEAIRKAVENAKKEMKKYSLHGVTIPHEVTGRSGAGKVFMKPASEGTGVIAGGAVRMILDVLGVKDILTKSIGTSNPYNMSKALLNGLSQMRSKEDIAAIRGVAKERLG